MILKMEKQLKSKQLDLFEIKEEPKVEGVYYNGLGEPLPWEAKKEQNLIGY